MNKPTITISREEHAALRIALAPLAMIYHVWLANGLDEDRPDWRNRNVGGIKPFDEVELFSGRGGRSLLTLGDAVRARDALTGIQSPDQGAAKPGDDVCMNGRLFLRELATTMGVIDVTADPDEVHPISEVMPKMLARAREDRERWHEAPTFSGIRSAVFVAGKPYEIVGVAGGWVSSDGSLKVVSELRRDPPKDARDDPRDMARDLDYLSSADAHADEGPLGEAAARSILAIAHYWLIKSHEIRVCVKRPGGSDEVVVDRVSRLADGSILVDVTATTLDEKIETLGAELAHLQASAPVDRRRETVDVLMSAFGEYACMIRKKLNSEENAVFETNFAVPARKLLAALKQELIDENERTVRVADHVDVTEKVAAAAFFNSITPRTIEARES